MIVQMDFEAILLFLTSITTVDSFNCEHAADGAYEISCQSFTQCTKGIAKTIECHLPQVVNPETLKCDSSFNVTTPCGVFRDCSYRDDGNYPEVESDCHWFYTCSNGIFYGHHHCSGGLVLNTKLQICDFEYNVPPPCGTKTF